MSGLRQLRTQKLIDEEAAAWLWRVDSGTMSVAERESFSAWLRADLRHRRALEELGKVWNVLDGMAEAEKVKPAVVDADVSSVWRVVAVLRHAASKRVLHWSLAASVVLAACISIFWVQRHFQSLTIATAVGQQREVELRDDSLVMLNTNSIVDIRQRWSEREVFLRKGEAHFRVAHDRSRPFLVHAGDVVVRAVGTQFDVHMRSYDRIDVLVNEGRVEVESPSSAGVQDSEARANVRMRRHAIAANIAQIHAVSAGEQLSSDKSKFAVTTVSSERLSNELAWRDGAIVFDSWPLSQAIGEIGRYTETRIVVTDPRVASLRVGGRFRTGDTRSFLAALQAALPIHVRYASADLVYIDPRQ